MPPKRFRLPHTFPHKIVFIISLVLCMCACGSIVAAVVAWSNYLWGYYIGTGFWSGAVILLAGMFGIVASYVRSICAVKTFMIISIFGCLASLGMIALASGGLDPESGFYNGFNKTTFMTHVIHSIYLGLGVLQLTLSVLSDGICIYYLFIERSAELYCVKNDDPKKRKKNRGNIRRHGKDRSSTGSQVPLIGESKSFKRKSKESKDGSMKKTPVEPVDESTEVNEIFPIPYTATGLLDRDTLLRQEILMSKISPVRTTPYTRSSSFSTFGRTSGPDRESLIVHPTDDNASVTDTVVSAPQSPDDECHYAQTVLFGPPLPIEEDETLPPYEAIDNARFRQKPRRGLKRPKSEDLQVLSRHSRRSQEREKRNSSKRSRNSQSKEKIPQGRIDYVFETGSLKKPHGKHNADGDGAVLRLSKSADLLSAADETTDTKSTQSSSSIQEQGVALRDFTHSSEMIRVSGHAVQLRHKRPQSQTMRVNRDKRLDRRRKALSAEVKLNKGMSLSQEGILVNETDLEHRTNSIHGSNSSLFASNRTIPTKFSLRTPVRGIGMPHVCSPVPVKPLVPIPRVSPPPKPPRNYSVTADDLKDLEMDTDGEVEQVFADINDLNNTGNEDNVFTEEQLLVSKQSNKEKSVNELESIPSKVAVVQASRILPSNKETESGSKQGHVNLKATTSIPLSPEVKLDSGPVLKFILPCRETKQLKDNVDDNRKKDNSNSVRNDFATIDKSKKVQPVEQPTDTMVVPTSPILRSPQVVLSAANKLNNSVKTVATTIVGKGTIGNTDKRNAKPNSIEVVYAKVVKESPVAAVSPASPVSPTSPSAKAQKAKRLTYSFKDKDVSVFDPIGNTKETEETVELVESVSEKHPVEIPKETQQPNKGNEQSIKIDSGPTVKVRMPPLSPSERSLQRKPNKNENHRDRDISPSKEDRPVIIQPANAFKDFNKSAYGARPKASHKGVFAPLVLTKPSDENQMERPFKNNVSPNQNFAQPNSSQIIKRNTPLPSTSPKHSNKPANRSNKIIESVPNNALQTSSSAISSSVPTTSTISRDVPVNRVQAMSVSQAVSQGVLRLPQSQYSRQVPDNVLPPVMDVAASPQNINVIPQNNAQQNNNNQPNKPLFSVVL